MKKGVQPKLHTLGIKTWKPSWASIESSNQTQAPIAKNDQDVIDVGLTITVGIATCSTPVTEDDEQVVDVDDIIAVEVAIAWDLWIDHIDVTEDGALVEDLDSPDLTPVSVERGAGAT